MVEIRIRHPGGSRLGPSKTVLKPARVGKLREFDLPGRRIGRKRVEEPAKPAPHVRLNVPLRLADLAEMVRKLFAREARSRLPSISREWGDLDVANGVVAWKLTLAPSNWSLCSGFHRCYNQGIG